MSLKIISERFHRFAIRECRGSSELYEQLSVNVAEERRYCALLQLPEAASRFRTCYLERCTIYGCKRLFGRSIKSGANYFKKPPAACSKRLSAS
jgi:hypothetical protein